MTVEDLSNKKIKVFYNGEEYHMDARATEDQVREALAEKFPEAANATITRDEEGNWTVTREAGQKGR